MPNAVDMAQSRASKGKATAAEHASAQAPVTRTEKAQAEAEIRRLRSALKNWLKYRQRNNEIAQGKRKAKAPPGLAKKIISNSRDWPLEQKIATRLHILLSELFDASRLPDPDVRRDPDAAAKLAQIAISGKLDTEVPSTQPTGAFWVWPAVAVVGLLMVTVMFKIRSDAQLAAEKERIECIKLGGCTDYGFWIKVGGVALFAYLAWEKFGLKELAGRGRRKAAG